jgi:uncharacterized protein YndB with AHSA1/START domain
MEEIVKSLITVNVKIKAPISLVWKKWTNPEDIVIWNSASEDWHTPWAENDLRAGGKFRSRMEARDGSMGFDFEGIYLKVVSHELIEYEIADGRKVSVLFKNHGSETEIVETFEAEGFHSIDLQQAGWQLILDNFKKYTEQKLALA